jgi:hypothetical protein
VRGRSHRLGADDAPQVEAGHRAFDGCSEPPGYSRGEAAAFCAAFAARERGARVLMLERAPAAESGGNSGRVFGRLAGSSAGAAIHTRADAAE